MFNEDFIRCEECDYPFFGQKERYLLSDSGNDSVLTKETYIQFYCLSCNHPKGKEYRSGQKVLYTR